MDNAWQPQETDASNGISIPTQDSQAEYSNGNGHRASRSRSPTDRGRSGGDGEGTDNPGNNLHVSGLSREVGNPELESAFAKVGRVQKVSVVYDPHTRESRLFGFVTMESREEADAAVAALNATELLGKVITVVRARRGRARTPTPGRYHGPSKRRPRDRPYEVRPYDSRYSRDSGRSSRYDDYRGSSRRDHGDRDRYRERDSRRDDRDYRDRDERPYREDYDRYDRYDRERDRERDRRY